MNLRAKCMKNGCPAFGVEKSVLVGQMMGYKAPNDRVACPFCGELMRTTKSINVSSTKGFRKTLRRVSVSRSVTHRKMQRRKRVYKRWTGKR